jgi:poly-beta-1,6-N-acetyl-D-glucosamine synthase
MSFEIISTFVVFVLAFLNLFKLTILYLSTDLYHIYSHFFVKETVQSKTEPKSIAIIIPAHNEELVIYRTLESVCQNQYPLFKVYVADDGSTDGTKSEIDKFLLRHPHANLEYIYRPNSGKAEALNNVIKKHTTEDIVMCLDADCILNHDAIEKSVVYFDNPKVAAMISNVKIMPIPKFVNFVQRLEYMMGFYLKKGLNTTNLEYIVGGAGSVFRKSVLEKVNYYDSDTITEDIDLSMKIIDDGKQNLIVFGYDVLVHTQGPTTVSDLFKQRYRWKLGWVQTIFKNRHMLFNPSFKYNWLFTLYYLPYMVFSQAMFLFDPIFVAIILYGAFVSQEFLILTLLFFFYFFLTCLAVLGDDHINLREKIFYILVAPMSYIAMTVVSVLEYAALVKAIFNWKKVIFHKQNSHTSWSHVQRVKH